MRQALRQLQCETRNRDQPSEEYRVHVPGHGMNKGLINPLNVALDLSLYHLKNMSDITIHVN